MLRLIDQHLTLLTRMREFLMEEISTIYITTFVPFRKIAFITVQKNNSFCSSLCIDKLKTFIWNTCYWYFCTIRNDPCNQQCSSLFYITLFLILSYINNIRFRFPFSYVCFKGNFLKIIFLFIISRRVNKTTQVKHSLSCIFE